MIMNQFQFSTYRSNTTNIVLLIDFHVSLAKYSQNYRCQKIGVARNMPYLCATKDL